MNGPELAPLLAGDGHFDRGGQRRNDFRLRSARLEGCSRWIGGLGRGLDRRRLESNRHGARAAALAPGG
jgi:hypothetical protein